MPWGAGIPLRGPSLNPGFNPGGPGAVFDDGNVVDAVAFGGGRPLQPPARGGQPAPAGNAPPMGVPIGGHAPRNRPQPWFNPPNPLGMLAGNAMMSMGNLGDLIGSNFAFANAQSSANRQASYAPEAAMQIAQLNNDAENYRTNARLAAQLASMGMLGKIMGGFGGLFGGGGGGYGGMSGFRATDSPQQASFSGGGGLGSPPAQGRRPPIQMPFNVMSSPTRQAMWMQRYGG